jgi:hypothetical protein
MRIDADRLGDEIAELAAHLDAATHRLPTLIRRFDDVGGWADHGALTCARWLSWRTVRTSASPPRRAGVAARGPPRYGVSPCIACPVRSSSRCSG